MRLYKEYICIRKIKHFCFTCTFFICPAYLSMFFHVLPAGGSTTSRGRVGSTHQEVGVWYESSPYWGIFWYAPIFYILSVVLLLLHHMCFNKGHGFHCLHLSPSGRCARCGDNVLGDGSGCIAMEQVFHVECFTCITCHARLRGQPFYALDRKSYCESCYIVSCLSSLGFCLLFCFFLSTFRLFSFVLPLCSQSTLERCSKCSEPILDRILRAMGKAYHPRCFTCVVCGCCLDGVPFTVDATSQIHCIEDFHRYSTTSFFLFLCGLKSRFLLINSQMQIME